MASCCFHLHLILLLRFSIDLILITSVMDKKMRKENEMARKAPAATSALPRKRLTVHLAFVFFFVWVLRIRIMFVTNFHEFPMWINSNSPRYIALPKFQKLTKTLQKPAHQQKQKTTPKISKFLILSSLSYRCCE